MNYVPLESLFKTFPRPTPKDSESAELRWSQYVQSGSTHSHAITMGTLTDHFIDKNPILKSDGPTNPQDLVTRIVNAGYQQGKG